MDLHKTYSKSICKQQVSININFVFTFENVKCFIEGFLFLLYKNATLSLVTINAFLIEGANFQLAIKVPR